MSSLETKAQLPEREARCAHCGKKEGLQAMFLGIGDTSALLCEQCSSDFQFSRAINSQIFVGSDTVKEGVRMILQGLHEMYGLNLEQEDIQQTPERVSRMFAELCCGYAERPADHLRIRYPVVGVPQLCQLRDINFVSMCRHHLAMIVGKVHIGYVPKEWYVGLSKLARVVEAFAKRLQLQEHMTNEIADCIVEGLEPQGVMVVVQARHDCMCKRGVMKPDSLTVTSAVRGVFYENKLGTKDEFLALLQMGNET